MPTSPTLIGRETEIAQLEAGLTGPGQLILVSGEAGIGKSRLLRDFADRFAARGGRVVWGRPEVISVPGPYSLVLDLLDNITAAFGAAAGAEAETLAEQLSDPNSSRSAPPSSLARHVAARLRGLIASTEPAPIVILEDLHSVDEASLAVVFHLGRTARDDGRLLVASARTDMTSENGVDRMIETLRRDQTLTQVHLDRLNPEQVAEVVKLTLGHAPEVELLEYIQRMSEGVPLFVEELASSRLAISSGTMRAQLPQAIRESVLRQLELLPNAVREIVFYAALLDGPIEPKLLAQVAGIDPSEMRRLTTTALGSGLLVERGDSIVFRHHLVRQVIASLERDDQRSLRHQNLANGLAILHGASPVHAWQLARQFYAARNYPRAASFALQAGNHALSVAATADARVAFEAARDWMATDDMLRKASEGLALAELRDGNDMGAAQHSRIVVELLKKSGRMEEAAASLGRLSLILTRAGDREGASVALDEALDLFSPTQNSSIAVRLMTQKANFLTFYLGRFDEASSLIERATAIADSLAERAVLAIAMDGKAEIHSVRGEFSAAEAAGEESLRLAIGSGDPEAIGRTHNNHAVRLVLHGRARAAITVLDAGRQFIGEHYGSAGVSSLDIARAWAYQMQGEPQAALELLANLTSVWMSWRGVAAAINVWARIERGDRAEAEILLRRAWQEAGFRGWREVAEKGSKVNPDVLELLAAEVQVQLAFGQIPEAAGAASTYRAFSHDSGQPSEWMRACALNALALVTGGQIARARGELQALGMLLEDRPYPYWKAVSSEVAAAISHSVGQDTLAHEQYTRSVSLYAACSNSVDQARCLRRTAELASSGQPSELAKELLDRARELALAAGGLVELSRIESDLRQMGVRPRAGRPKKGAPKRDLSAREEQIAGLVAAGLTNTEIARQLYLSDGTVAGYISSSLRKLGLPGRAALAAWSAKAGLI